MENSELRQCPWGCPPSLAVRGGEAVECGHCYTRGPNGLRVASRLGLRLPSSAMIKALGMHLWNLRGPGVAAKATAIAELASRSANVKEFETALKAQGLYGTAAQSSGGQWAECQRSYKSLTQGVEYKILGVAERTDNGDVLRVMDNYDAEVLAPASVFGR